MFRIGSLKTYLSNGNHCTVYQCNVAKLKTKTKSVSPRLKKKKKKEEKLREPLPTTLLENG